MTDRKRLLLLASIMATACLIVATITIYILYDAAFAEERARLIESAKSQARLMEAVARFDSIYSKEDNPQGWEGATLSQIRDAHEQYEGFGETGEVTLARRDGDQIVFLLSHRHSDLENPKPVPFQGQYAEPMRLALSGRSGTILGLDYRGERVLAAYEPVAVLNLGLVVKIDLAEIRAPFIRAGFVTGIAAIFVIVTGALLFIRIGKPIIQHLEESEARTRTILQTAVDGVITIDEQGNIESFNPAAEKIFGYSADEVMGKNASMLMPVPFREEQEGSLAGDQGTDIRKMIGASRDVTGLRKDGTTFFMDLSVSEVRLADRRIFTGFVRDITKRRRAAKALRESEEKNRMLVESSPYCIHQIDTNARLISMNPAGLQMMGVNDEDEIIQLPYLDVVANDDRDRIGELMELAFLGRSSQFDFRAINDRIFQSAFIPIKDRAGAVIRLMGLTQDITERERAEKALQESEKQLLHAQKMEALGRLTGGIAHDFRNLLMGVMGCCRLAENNLASNSAVKPYIEEIIALAETGAALTRQLVTFSRKREVQLKPIMINSVISAMEGMLRRLLGEDSVLRVILSPSGGPMMADQGHIEQILINLAVNACDAMAGGGELTIKTVDVDLDEENGRWHGDVKPGSYVMLVVSDTGCGISTETQARIFEPFFTTKENDGAGLGLSTVYGIVKQLGGDIEIDSRLGGGATFSLLFPRSERPLAVAEAGTDEEALAGGTETVLVVEDNRVVRMTVRSYLEDLGYKVLEASGSVEALRICKEHSGRIELLLTDMVLPQMSGRDLSGQIQTQEPRVKVLYMSAYPADFLEEQGHLQSSHPSLEKPFTKSTLAAKVREVLD